MPDNLTWLSQEAIKLHTILQSYFYLIATLLLVLGVAVEFLKIPMGGIPSLGTLIGRVIVAAVLLQAYPSIANGLSDLSQQLTNELGGMNHYNEIRSKIADQIYKFFTLRLSVKGLITTGFCYVLMVICSLTIDLIEAYLLFLWTLYYVFSPILIALFIFPPTAPATTGLFRGIIEMSFWKPVWAVMATLLWSYGLSDITRGAAAPNFLTVIAVALLFVFGLLLTPFIIKKILGGALAVMPGALMNVWAMKRMAVGAVHKTAQKVTEGGKLGGPLGKLTYKAMRAPRKVGQSIKKPFTKNEKQNDYRSKLLKDLKAKNGPLSRGLKGK